MKHLFLLLLFFSLPCDAYTATNNVVNVYAWTNEIPDFAVRLFEKEKNIKVNFSTYENNEVMYAKLRASKNAGYDVVMPSSYFVDRMQRQGMIEKLDKTKLSNWKNLNPQFLNPSYDPHSEYSVPFIWGVTGIFYNAKYFQENSIKKWTDLWDKRFYNQLMLLDDTREIFSMALLSLGFSPNDQNSDHIKAAYLQLKKLMPNVKVFSSETVISIMIDEDATVGMAWNGDAAKAASENPNVRYTFPQDGFVIWVDNFSIPSHAPHKEAAYAFINFMTRADIAKEIALYTANSTTNLAAQNALPENIRNNPMIYPPKDILKRGQFQMDLDEKTLALYEKYWEKLKMGDSD